MGLTEGSGLTKGTLGVGNPSWQLAFTGIGLHDSGQIVPLNELAAWRGYLPVEVAMKCEPIKLACEVGSQAQAGGWTFRVTQLKRVPTGGGRGGSGPTGARLQLQLEMKAEGESSLPVPKDLARFVHGEPSPPEGVPETRTMAAGYGGIERDRLITVEFPEEYFPKQLTIDMPVEVKAAALPFEFDEMKAKGKE